MGIDAQWIVLVGIYITACIQAYFFVAAWRIENQNRQHIKDLEQKLDRIASGPHAK